MAKIKEINLTYIYNIITTTPNKVSLQEVINSCLAEGVFKEFYIHYPMWLKLIEEHNSQYWYVNSSPTINI